MGETFVRQWLILSMLPTPPRRIGTAAIEAALRERGIDIHRRTIQRDLVELSEVFPIVVDDRSKPYGWRWAAPPSLPVPLQGPRLMVTLRAPTASLEALATRLRVRVDGDQAHLHDTPDTRRLLLAHADEVEVVSPPGLRTEIFQRLQRAIARHG